MIFSKIPDISLTAVNFPDISRFSRQVVTLYLHSYIVKQRDISDCCQSHMMIFPTPHNPRDPRNCGPQCCNTHSTSQSKVEVWTLATVPLTWVRLVTSSALQYQKWQLIGMSHWCHSALRGHPLPVLTDNWTHDAASRHTTTPISHTRPSPRSRSYYSFPVPLRVGGWVGLSIQ